MTKPFIPNDSFAQKARRAGFLARSAFKLEEINKRYSLLTTGQKVLDLGAAPGSWLQVASQIVGKEGLVVGADLEPIKFTAPNVKTFQIDVFDQSLMEVLAPYSPLDVIISDLAPKTSGIKDRDQELSLKLSEQVLLLTIKLLKLNGSLVIKIFQSSKTPNLIKKIKTMFKTVHVFKPASSRDRSFETYIIGLNKID